MSAQNNDQASDLGAIPVRIVHTAADGGGIEDIVFTDDTNTVFVYRDNGATPPSWSPFTIPAAGGPGVAYTVGANPRPFAAKNVVVSNFPSTQQISTTAMALRGLVQQITPYGTARVSIEPGSLLNDTFESALDTTNRWTASGTVPPTSTGGTLSLNAGTTNSATSILTSQPTFAPTAGFLLAGATCTFDAAKVANANSNYTFGFAACAAPTATAPIDNGYVWERTASGELCCCVYVSGTRYVINSTDASLITPQASLPGGATGGASTSTFSTSISWPAGKHVLLIAVRGDLCFWYIDSFDVPVGVAQRFEPAVQTLPLRIAQINAAASVLATTNTFSALLVADSASQNQSLSDPTYPWRRQAVTSKGAAGHFDAGDGSHVYAYTNGLLTTDTRTLDGVVKVKTFAYTSGVLTSESDWV